MSTEQTPTPEQDPQPTEQRPEQDPQPTEQRPEQDPQPTGQREITVSVPEDRVEQFQAFYERFLAVAKRREAHAGRRARGGGRRGGSRRHHIRRAMFHLAMAEEGSGSRHGRCGRRQAADEGSTPGPTATL